MNKKGDIWISAALYTAIGIILIGLVLSVGMPFINKVKMRNTMLQTKEVMYNMDNVIREVWNEGLGSRRPIFVEIQEGDFLIDDTNDEIRWNVISEDKLGIEPLPTPNTKCETEETGVIPEGNLKICSEQLGQGFNINLWLDYKDNINIASTAGTKQLSGAYNLVIEHAKNSDTDSSKYKCDGGKDKECVLIREA